MPRQTVNLDAGLERTYQIVSGSKTVIQKLAATVMTTTEYSLTAPSNRCYSNGFPGGKTGVYSNLAGVQFDTPDVESPDPAPDFLGRWEGPFYGNYGSGNLLLYNGPKTNSPIYLKNLRLQKFQATFSFTRPDTSSYQQALFVFNGTDADNWQAVIFAADGTAGDAPAIMNCTNGQTTYLSCTTTAAPACSGTQTMWCRVSYDGTTLKAWQLVNSGATPSSSDWSGATLTLSSTATIGTGGRVGFHNTYGGNYTPVSNFSIQSYDAATSSFDITEDVEDFSIDTNNFANGNSTNLASDSNGNQTFDGTQVYTYDAWNRLMTVSHGYRDSSNNLQHGQAAVAMGYDAEGRRITKAVANTGSWDCTYNYYYKGNSAVEEQNGSAQTIKQFVWGVGYIDDLVQTSLNSSPTSQSTCDTPYWMEQDTNWNVLGIVNSSGVLTERYEYGAYGQRTTYVSAGTNDPFCTAATTASTRFIASSAAEPWGLCEVGHQGLMHDEESGLVVTDHRYLHPVLGRWLQREPAGGRYVDGLNLYQAYDSDPINEVDPEGLDAAGASGKPCCNGVQYDPTKQCCENNQVVSKQPVYVINRSGGQRTGLTEGHIDMALPGSGLIGYYGYGNGGASNGVGMGLTGHLNMGLNDWVNGPTQRQKYVQGAAGGVLSTICQIMVCPSQVAQMNAAAKAMQAKPGTFNIVGGNCATHACSILGAGGVMKSGISGIDNPQHLQDQLTTGYSANCFTGYTQLDNAGNVTIIQSGGAPPGTPAPGAGGGGSSH